MSADIDDEMGLRECPECGRAFSWFRWRRSCAACEQLRCRSCLIDSRLPEWASGAVQGSCCRACHKDIVAPLESRYRAAKESRVEVFAYFGSYRGEPSADPETRLGVESGFHSEKDDAVKELQTMAAFHGREAIDELRFIEKGERDTTARPGEGPVPFAENHRSTWKAAGVAFSTLKPRTQES